MSTLLSFSRQPICGDDHLARRVRSKLASVTLQPEWMAFLDGLTDIEPRRTTPAAVDVIVTGDGRTFVIFEGDRPHYIAWIDDVRVWLQVVARMAKLSRRERNWIFMLLTKATG